MRMAGFNSPVVAVRFCPTLFELKASDSAAAVSSANPVFDLPYRMIFAVATMDSVMIMDTQHLSPLALVGGVHWAAITDLAWAADGRKLVVSSSDGYCSVVLFEEGELGAAMDRAKVPAHVAAVVWPEPHVVENEKEVKTGKMTATAKAEGGENANPNLPADAAAAAKAAPRRITPAAVPTTTTTDASAAGETAAGAAPRRITPMATSATAASTSEATAEGGAKRRIAPVAMDATPAAATTTDGAAAAPSGTQGEGEEAVPAAAGQKRRIAPVAVVAAADAPAASVETDELAAKVAKTA